MVLHPESAQVLSTRIGTILGLTALTMFNRGTQTLSERELAAVVRALEADFRADRDPMNLRQEVLDLFFYE